MTMVSGTKEKAPRIYQSAHFLQVDMDVVELLHGDWKAACLLGMILDMQQQSLDGWVYHSWPQWEDHHFSRAEVERCAALLTPLGLEIQLRDHIGRQTRHYHIDVAKLKAALSPLQRERKEKNEAHATTRGIHPVEKLQGATKLHDAENLQGPCEKVTGHPVEKLQGLLGSDLITKSTETDQLADANASCGEDAALPDASSDELVNEVTEDSPEYKLACYLYDAIKRMDEHAQLPYRTIKGLSTWIDPPKGKGLRHLLSERGETERPDIKRVIDWLALPETSSFWQTRFINRKNNPGRMIYEKYSELKNASTPRQRGTTNGQQQHRPVSPAGHTPAVPHQAQGTKAEQRAKRLALIEAEQN